MSTEMHSALLIAVMSGVTILLRLLPFCLFSGKKQPPACILYLGRVLPGAVLGMLVIYCLRDVTFLAAPYGLRELLAVLAVVGVQALRRSSILSILAGTGLYLLLGLWL